jgi:hypothetical protein
MAVTSSGQAHGACRRTGLNARADHLDRETTVMRIVAAGILLTSVFGALAGAQAHYYNLDAGRPTRVEDAVPTERNGLDLHLAALRLERLDDGTYRWRGEPKLSIGLLPMTSFELRTPITHLVRPGARGRGTTALAGIGVGALRALNVETARLPALALAGEALVPVGGFSSGRTSYAIQMLATKTTPIVRAHLNASLGTYGVRAPRQIASTGPICPLGFVPAPGGGCEEYVFPPDVPCAVAPVGTEDGGWWANSVHASPFPGPSPQRASSCRAAPVQQIAQRPYGLRWAAGVGVDRTFPLQSMLVAADVFAERFHGLYRNLDWTAELGVRRQWSPEIVLDFGVARRFAGTTRSSSLTLGLTYSFPTRLPRIPRLAVSAYAPGPTATGPFEQAYLAARHNWTFHDRYPRAQRLLNGFDYGHAILYETLIRTRAAATAGARLDRPVYERVVQGVLRHPPHVGLEERAIGPLYATLVPELLAMFEWAHVLHRQLYDVMADERLSPAEREARARDVLRYYQSRGDLALSTAPKSMDLMEGQPYSLTFRRAAPKFNGLIWSYHWLQIALYEALLLATNPGDRLANVDTSLAQFWAMVDGAPAGLPTVMPMSPAVAPRFSELYPEAAIIFDNLHALHDVAADILASPIIPSSRKRASVLRAAAAYRDSTTGVTSREEWRQHSLHMGVKQMGGRTPVRCITAPITQHPGPDWCTEP